VVALVCLILLISWGLRFLADSQKKEEEPILIHRNYILHKICNSHNHKRSSSNRACRWTSGGLSILKSTILHRYSLIWVLKIQNLSSQTGSLATINWQDYSRWISYSMKAKKATLLPNNPPRQLLLRQLQHSHQHSQLWSKSWWFRFQLLKTMFQMTPMQICITNTVKMELIRWILHNSKILPPDCSYSKSQIW